jgi:hypothetical protein
MHLNDAGQFGHGGHIACGRRTESAMDADTAARLNAIAGQLAEALMTAAICAREIQAAVRTEIDEADLGHGVTPQSTYPLLTFPPLARVGSFPRFQGQRPDTS